jgi:tetratricopeptide (TPR) repeat protein
VADREAAAQLYELMLPDAEEVVTSQATWVGPAAHDLGLVAATLGRYDEADSHFAAAVELELRMGCRAILVHTRLEWARALLYRDQPGDRSRARELLDEALDGPKSFSSRARNAASRRLDETFEGHAPENQM